MAKIEHPERGVVYQSHYFAILRDQNGIEYVRTGDEVLIVPLTEDERVILIDEPSAAFGGWTLVLPGGETEIGESHKTTADRELQEEIGYRANQLELLGELRPYSKYLTVRSWIYLARDLTPSRLAGDEDYEIQTVTVKLADFETLISSGRLRDARVIAALFLARQFLEHESG